mgnify:CR=1 FL=1
MATTIIDDIYSVEAGLRIWRICHAGFLVKHKDVVIIFDPAMEVLNPADPYISEHPRGLRLVKKLPFLARDLKTVDLVLVTHADEDHCGAISLPILEPKTRVFVGPPETTSVMRARGIPYSKIRRAYFNEPIHYGDITIVPTIAEHHQPYGGACGFIVHTSSGSVWHPGDTPVIPAHYSELVYQDIRVSYPHLELNKPPDVLLLPIARHVFGPEEGGRLANKLCIPHVIPTHYGTYDSDGFAYGDVEAVTDYLDDHERRLHVLELGEMFHLRK